MSDSPQPNKTIRSGLPPGARLLHVYNPGQTMRNGKISDGKQPNENRGHHDAVPADMFFDNGSNIGIALDGQYVVVDFDVAGDLTEAEAAKLPRTWQQKTYKGTHHLFAVPPGFKGRNVKYVAQGPDGRQRIIGDIKALGYIVGPGSARTITTESGDPGLFVYHVVDDIAPVAAPPWLLDRAREADESFEFLVEGEAAERDRIEQGRNDDELIKIAGFLRHRGFTTGAIEKMLTGVIESGILEQDESNPYTRSDAQRIARSAGKYSVGEQAELEVLLKPAGWVCASDIALVQRPQEWWLPRFVAKAALTMLFGDGGIGKSSWLSWLAAQVTKQGGSVAVVGVEEPFWLFALRAVQHGADRSKLFSVPVGSALTIPRDAQALAEAVQAHGTGLLIFDSIFTHFEREKASNSAERARAALGPLAEIAQRTGCAILGNFHENKAGDFLGSAEMKNVGRAMLHATRQPGKPLRISVVKTNALEPDYHLEYEGVPTVLRDPETGAVQREVLEGGEVVDLEIMLPGDPTKVSRSSVAFEEMRDMKNEERAAAAAGRAEQAKRLKSEGLTVREIASEMGVGESTIWRYLSEK